MESRKPAISKCPLALAGNIRRRRAKTLSTWHEYVYRSTDRLQNLSWYLSADRPLILGVLYYGANPNIVPSCHCDYNKQHIKFSPRVEMTKTLGSFELPLSCTQQHRYWAVYGVSIPSDREVWKQG
jgi:hypothetical protein